MGDPDRRDRADADSGGAEDRDPADRPEPSMSEASDNSGVPRAYRAANAGGTMSETVRSREPDLDDEDGQVEHSGS